MATTTQTDKALTAALNAPVLCWRDRVALLNPKEAK